MKLLRFFSFFGVALAQDNDYLYEATDSPVTQVFFFLTDLEGTIPPFTGKSMWNLRFFLHWVFKGTDPVVAL